MIPLRDTAPSATFPLTSIILIVLNTLVWFYELSFGEQMETFASNYGVVPFQVLHYSQFEGGFWRNAIIPLFSSLFMHGGWLHLIGNMWFLWIFGDNIEDGLGHWRFLIFYLLCGIGAAMIQVAADPLSKIPIIGASGAISGVLGAYFVNFPHARISTLLIIFVLIRFVELPAFLFLIIWFVFQFVSGASQWGAQHEGGIAYWAHMGGFAVGILLIFIFPKKPKRSLPLRHD